MPRYIHVLVSGLAVIYGICAGIVMLGLGQPPAASVAFSVLTGLVVIAVQHGARKHLHRLARRQHTRS